MDKKRYIKSKLINLIDINDEEAIKSIDIFLDEPYIERDLDLVFNIAYLYDDVIIEVLKSMEDSYGFVNDDHKVLQTMGIILQMKNYIYDTPF